MIGDIFKRQFEKGYPEYNPAQARGKGGRWVAGAASHLESLRARHTSGMSAKEASALKKDVKAHIKDLNDQLKAARDLHNKIGAKPKAWWQVGDKRSDRPSERIGMLMQRRGYSQAAAMKYLYDRLQDENYSLVQVPRGLKWTEWINDTLSEVPSSIVMDMAYQAPPKLSAKQRADEEDRKRFMEYERDADAMARRATPW